MANNAWQMHFDPTRVHLKPKGKNQFDETKAPPGPPVNPPAGSFPVITSVRPRLTDDAAGAAPLAAGARAAAVLELIGRLKPANPKSTAGWTPLGTINGTIDFNTGAGAKPLPRFTCGSVKTPGSASVRLDFTEATADVVTRSDWVVKIEKHAETFDTGPVQSFLVKLPWNFDEKTPTVQLSARLRQGTTVVCDESRNTPLDIPLTHKGVPDDLDAANSDITFFGVRTVLPTSMVRSRLTLGGNRVLVFIDPSLASFVTTRSSANALTEMRADIRTVLADVGFPTIEIVMPGDANFAAENTRNTGFFRNTNGKFHSTNIKDLNKFLPDRRDFSTGDGSTIPFFEFFVCLESADPPGGELGEGERFSVPEVNRTAVTKLVLAPIILFGGSSSTSKGIRSQLGQISTADHGHFFANIVCHEIGHSLGLRHGVTFPGASPYTDNDSLNSQNSLMYITSVLQPGTGGGQQLCRLNFFGPVQRGSLRTAYSIP